MLALIKRRCQADFTPMIKEIIIALFADDSSSILFVDLRVKTSEDYEGI